MGVIKLTIREFRNGFYKYVLDICEVSKDGKVIGYWTPDITQQFPNVPAFNYTPAIGCARSEQSQEPIVEEIKCAQCKNPAVYAGSHFEDGEEHRISLCLSHHTSYPHKRNLKKING